ncbi:MAG: hypothetical protein JW836_16320 [Deltaproteobacteria bacterium]|nr:hypothetical protein [Deltaproteobacteria bacterium]
MKAKELTTIWGAPEPPKLTPKQLSIRLPILVAAKISALCEMFPRRTKTDIVGDLLTVALDQLEKSFIPVKGLCIQDGSQYYQAPVLYEDIGDRATFLKFTEKNLRELEKEAGVEEPMEFRNDAVVSEENLNIVEQAEKIR